MSASPAGVRIVAGHRRPWLAPSTTAACEVQPLHGFGVVHPGHVHAASCRPWPYRRIRRCPRRRASADWDIPTHSRRDSVSRSSGCYPCMARKPPAQQSSSLSHVRAASSAVRPTKTRGSGIVVQILGRHSQGLVSVAQFHAGPILRRLQALRTCGIQAGNQLPGLDRAALPIPVLRSRVR